MKPSRILSCVVFCAFLLFCRNHDLSAQNPILDEEEFFSHERFSASTFLIAKMSYDKGTRKDLKAFARSFMDGIVLVEEGELEEARKELLKASELWPEYFGTDFLLALVYEDLGDTATAARFYKTYLNKLRDFQKGHYRISGPLIRLLGAGNIEEYDTARELVEKRLRDYGIRLAQVRPVAQFPALASYIVLVAVFAGLYLAVIYRLVPYLKKRQRVKHPPEGFWVCEYCGAASPTLSKVCNECRRPRG